LSIVSIDPKAVIFDMDGILLDSEPFWQEAEIEVFGGVGVELTHDLCRHTQGLRIDEVVAFWYKRHPWQGTSQQEVMNGIIDGVIRLVLERGKPLPGVHQAIEAVHKKGLKCALASSSAKRIIQAVLQKLELSSMFETVHSAEDHPFGKPHPAVYMATAEALGVEATSCIAVEDSINGLLSCLSAKMYAVAIPDVHCKDDPRYCIAQTQLDSLESFATFLDNVSS